MEQDQNQDEVQKINEDTVSAADVGYGFFGVAVGVVVGVAIVIGVFYIVRLFG